MVSSTYIYSFLNVLIHKENTESAVKTPKRDINAYNMTLITQVISTFNQPSAYMAANFYNGLFLIFFEWPKIVGLNFLWLLGREIVTSFYLSCYRGYTFSGG